jgi:hypothetical protein
MWIQPAKMADIQTGACVATSRDDMPSVLAAHSERLFTQNQSDRSGTSLKDLSMRTRWCGDDYNI